MAVVEIEIPRSEPTIERPEGQPGQIDDLAAGLHRAAGRFEEFADEAASLRNLRGFWGDGYTAYQEASGDASEEQADLRSTLERVGRGVTAHADALREHLRIHDDLVDRKARLDEDRTQLISDVNAATEATDAEIAELRSRAVDLRIRYAGLRWDHEELHRKVDADERLLATFFRTADTVDEGLSGAGGVPPLARDAMNRPGAPGEGSSPSEVNAWWRGLTPAEQDAVVAAFPGALGSANGLPASARDDANRILLDRDLAALEAKESEGTLTELERRMLANAREASEALADADRYTDPVDGHRPGGTLWMYDPAAFDGDGKVALGIGDMDTADDVAVFTPGIKSDMTDTGYYTNDMLNLYESTRYGGDGSGSAATMFWLGYDAPDAFNDPATLTQGRAAEGGEALANDVDALRAARPDDPAHMTAIGHSYGSSTTAHAADGGGLDVDDVVLIGSPGAGPVEHADDMGVDNVYVGRDSRDHVADLGGQGVTGHQNRDVGQGLDPSNEDFGATRFESENYARTEDQSWHERGTDWDSWSRDHSNYFNNDTEALYNMGRIVDGDHGAVNEAPHTYDPWWKFEQDPEYDDTPTRDVEGRSDTTERRTD